ncbi:hypothetical protein LF1_52690 [Rubripirellula obstinata]|uniref:Uncharacterized protein n=1 Tax=Rubripirellula obstinata TaxID=406547 RepID=A0A5B1CCU1_9BACT|nr:hypothetical protein [Rubripirellula obstinata]KAA1257420.1 hypothetical protein LF1_52690 [Rubripirellula obstinata]
MFRRTLIAVSLAVPLASNTIADEGQPSHLRNETLIVARIGDSNAFTAYSKHSGKWSTHAFAEGATVVPVMGETLAAFKVSGESVTELVAVDKNGAWKTQKLPKPASRTCTPVIGSDVAAFSIDGTVYGFSGLTGSWDTAPLPGPPQVAEDFAMVLSDDHICVFSGFTGSWAKSPALTVSK